MKKNKKVYNICDVTDELTHNIDNESEIVVINYRNSLEIEYEKIKVKFGIKLIKYLSDIKNEGDYFAIIYENFFILWRKIAIAKNSMSLFSLLNYLTKRESFNIKKTIFSSVTNENLNEPIYYKFISDFITL